MTAEQMVELVKIVVPLLIGGSVGGLIGFKIGVNKTIKQIQKGGDNSHMTQIGEVHHHG